MSLGSQQASAGKIRSLAESKDREPWEYFEDLRAQGDVVWDDDLNSWVVCSHAAYKELARMDDVFWQRPDPTSDERALSQDARLELHSGRYGLTYLHGEMHGKVHRWLTRAFAPRSIRKWRTELFRPVVNSLIDRIVEAGRAELISALAKRMPIRILAALEGLPWRDDHWIDRFRDLQAIATDHRSRFDQSVDQELSERVLAAINQQYELMLPFVRERRAGVGDDVISYLWREGSALFDEWTERDVLSQARGLFDPGIDTTGKGLANALYLFLSRPEVRDDLRAGGPGAIANFTDEALRLYSPRVITHRIARTDVELAGAHVRKGDSVTALIAVANRDPAVFEAPDALNLERPRPRDHFAFHAGPRFCAGAPLVRAEIEELIGVLLERLPDIRLDSSAEPPQYEGVVSRQFRPLHAIFTPGDV